MATSPAVQNDECLDVYDVESFNDQNELIDSDSFTADTVDSAGLLALIRTERLHPRKVVMTFTKDAERFQLTLRRRYIN